MAHGLVENPADYRFLYLGQHPGLDGVFTLAAKYPVNDGKADAGVKLHDDVALEGRYCQYANHAWIGNGLNKFLIGQLLYGGYFHAYQCSQIGGQVGVE